MAASPLIKDYTGRPWLQPFFWCKDDGLDASSPESSKRAVSVLRFRVLGFRVLGFKVLGFRVLGFRVLGFRVLGC